MYFPEEDKLITASNFGNIILMYTTNLDLYTDGQPVTIKTGKQYLEETEWLDTNQNNI